MRTTITAALLAALLLAGCSSEPDEAACKAAMKEQFAEALTVGKEGSRPAECEGVDDATLQRLAGEVMAEALDG